MELQETLLITIMDPAMFTTRDQDNDRCQCNCEQWHKSGWWYRDCHNSNLYTQCSSNYREDLEMIEFSEYFKFTEMKLRHISRRLGQKRLSQYRVRISESNAKSLNLTPKPLQLPCDLWHTEISWSDVYSIQSKSFDF